MAADFPANPFRPGPGQAPPVLAGRENVQRTLLKAVRESREQGVGGSPIVLIGPRGNGKTVLMGWLMDRIGDRMDAAWLSSDDTASREDLARSLNSRGVVERVRTLSGRGGIPGWRREAQRSRTACRSPWRALCPNGRATTVCW